MTSMHREIVFQAIPKGVFHRLFPLTTIGENNKDKTVDQTCPRHTEELIMADIVKRGEFPILSKCLLKKNEKDNSEKIYHRDMRTSCFTIAHCKSCVCNCAPQLIKRLKTKHNLTWIRTRMAYRRFENIEGFLINNANNRVMTGWI